MLISHHRHATPSRSNHHIIIVNQHTDSVDLVDSQRLRRSHHPPPATSSIFHDVPAFSFVFVGFLLSHETADRFVGILKSHIIWIDSNLSDNRQYSPVNAQPSHRIVECLLEHIANRALCICHNQI